MNNANTLASTTSTTNQVSYDKFDLDEERRQEREERNLRRTQRERERSEEFNRHKKQAYSEKGIFKDNRSRIDDFALKVKPPEVDYGVGPVNDNNSSSDGGFGNDGAQRMSYQAWYGNPYTLQQQEFELRRKYNGNLTCLPNNKNNTKSGGGNNAKISPLWDEGNVTYNSDEDDDDVDDDTVILGGGGHKRKDGSYRDEIDPFSKGSSRVTRQSNNKNTQGGGGGPSFNSQDTVTDDVWRSVNQWQYEKDPYGSGKSYLLRELKRKFLEMTSPIVDFVSTYLAMTGHQSENGIYDKIKMISQVEKANPMQEGDFDDLVRHLYTEDSDIATALIGHLASYIALQKEKQKLAGAVKKYKESANAATEVRRSAKKALRDLRQKISELDMILAEDDNYKDIARKLRTKYEYVASGNIVFVLNNVFRNEAQMVLDEINGFLHGRYTNRYFTLLEIMNSSYVRAKFIRMMIITKTSINVGGVTPITMLASNGSLAGGNTVADRMNSGTYRGNLDLNKTIVVQSRPTQANLVAGSLEYLNGLNLFRRVKKKNDGSNSLIIDSEGNSLVYGRNSRSPSSFYNHRGHPIPPFPSKSLPANGTYGYYGGGGGGGKRKRSAQEEVLDDVYYDVLSNTYKSREHLGDPTHKGVYGSYEDSVNAFTKEKQRNLKNHEDDYINNKKQKKMLVETDKGEFIRMTRGYGDPIKPITKIQPTAIRRGGGGGNRNNYYQQSVASYKDPVTKSRGLVNPEIMHDPRYAKKFYSTGRPSGPYNVTKMLSQRSGYL